MSTTPANFKGRYSRRGRKVRRLASLRHVASAKLIEQMEDVVSDDVTDTGAAATAVMDNVSDLKPVKPIPPAEIFRFLRENFTVLPFRPWAGIAHALPIIFLALLAIELYGADERGDGYFHILFGAIVIGVGVVLILLLLNYVRFAIWPTAKQAAALVILSALSAIFLGQWLGHSVLETLNLTNFT